MTYWTTAVDQQGSSQEYCLPIIFIPEVLIQHTWVYIRNEISWWGMWTICLSSKNQILHRRLRSLSFNLGNLRTFTGKRTDFHVFNHSKQRLEGSFYHGTRSSDEDKICVLYLHSMNGSRIESISGMTKVLPMCRKSLSWDCVSVISISQAAEIPKETRSLLEQMRNMTC